jgi:hypothetical protein
MTGYNERTSWEENLADGGLWRMNHSEAVTSGAVERYLLGQLSAAESEEFESHYFDCLECTRELRVAAIFEDNIRAVVLDERRSPKPSIWGWLWQRPWSVVPAVAGSAFAAVSIYQGLVVIPGLRGELHDAVTPQAVASYALAPISHGDARVLEVPKGGRFYSIYMDPTWTGSFAAYVFSMQDKAGSIKVSVHVPAPPPGKPLQILMARPVLPSGRYTATISNAAEAGKPEAELARYTLVLKLE